MAHFVAIPPPPNSHVPNRSFTKLALRDPSGNAAIAVWGCDPNWTIEATDNPRFVSDRYRTSGALTYFMLRGLKAGDRIGVFDGTNWQTELLEISFVGSDANPKNTVGSRRSAHKATLILDPGGIEQGVANVRANEWIVEVEKVIQKILSNAAGRIVMDVLTTDITIRPYLGAHQQATGGVQFTPQMFERDFRPSARPDEVLFHEFCHVADDNYGGYKDVAGPAPGSFGPLPSDDSLTYAPADFFSVTGTNVYSSVISRPLRRDWSDPVKMPAKYGDGAAGAARFRTFQEANFTDFRTRKGAIFTGMSGVTAPWNPFR